MSDDYKQKTSSMKTIARALAIVPGVLFMGLWLLIGLKGCIVTIWGPPNVPKTYAILGEDERELTFTFFPDRYAVATYADPREESMETVLFRVSGGTCGRHYIGPLWNVSERGDSIFGVRWISGDETPTRFSLAVVNKWQTGFGDPTFPDIGEKWNSLFYFRPSSFYYEGMWLQEIDYSPEVFGVLRERLEDGSDIRKDFPDNE